ncbi:alpha/beta-tubulin-N-acetyltransferase 9 isoform X2 [Cinclus cinclus]
MKINQDTVLRGKKVTLVPYTAAHVPRYHEWMQSEELQRLTASEPLSLEQEYEMQHSWRDDADKCTFIVLDSGRWPGQAEENSMVGDVNLFLTNTEDPTLGEIEIMIAGQVLLHSLGLYHCGCMLQTDVDVPISAFYSHALPWLFSPDKSMVCPGHSLFSEVSGVAGLSVLTGCSLCALSEPSCRGRGFGKEATLLMLAYGVKKLGITKFEAKIGQENEASICMFKKLHFKEVAVNSIFQEVTLRLDVSDQERRWLLEQTNHVQEKSYAELKQPAGALDS